VTKAKKPAPTPGAAKSSLVSKFTAHVAKRPNEYGTGFLGVVAASLISRFHITDPTEISYIVAGVAGLPAAITFLADRGGIVGIIRRILRGNG